MPAADALHEGGITTTYQLDQLLSAPHDAALPKAATALRTRLEEDPALARRLRAFVEAAGQPGADPSSGT